MAIRRKTRERWQKQAWVGKKNIPPAVADFQRQTANKRVCECVRGRLRTACEEAAEALESLKQYHDREGALKFISGLSCPEAAKGNLRGLACNVPEIGRCKSKIEGLLGEIGDKCFVEAGDDCNLLLGQSKDEVIYLASISFPLLIGSWISNSTKPGNQEKPSLDIRIGKKGYRVRIVNEMSADAHYLTRGVVPSFRSIAALA